jgi:hypothetical protein
MHLSSFSHFVTWPSTANALQWQVQPNGTTWQYLVKVSVLLVQLAISAIHIFFSFRTAGHCH